MKALYSCDTSVLIQAWMKDYRPKTFPRVWEQLDVLIEDGTVIAIDEVFKDLKKKQDELYKWAKDRAGMFVATDEAVLAEVKAILKIHGRLVEHRPGRSASDPFVIALARIRGAIVLTDEKPSGSIKKPKMPDVCSALGIECCHLAGLFDRHGIVFR